MLKTVFEFRFQLPVIFERDDCEEGLLGFHRDFGRQLFVRQLFDCATIPGMEVSRQAFITLVRALLDVGLVGGPLAMLGVFEINAERNFFEAFVCQSEDHLEAT